MPGNPPPVEAATLLAQREWVRRVARALVADPHQAEDLEQDLWVEVLERPPRPRTSLRGWLATALRSRLLNRRRSDSRRERRERAVPRREAVPSAEQVVAEAEAHRKVVDAVMALAEPYRTALLLRFFEDLAPSAAAARWGVPVETVRTRNRRALDLLRVRLDAGTGGVRSAWCLALAPLLRFPDGATATAPSAAGTAASAGGLLMTPKAVAATAAVLVAGGGIWWWTEARAGPDAAALSAEVARLRSQSEDQAGRIARLERSLPSFEAGAGPASGAAGTEAPLAAEVARLRKLVQQQAEAVARLERTVASSSAGGPALDPVAEGRRALEDLKANADGRRQIAIREALRTFVRIGDPIVPDIAALLDSGADRRYYEGKSSMAMQAGQVVYAGLRMALIDALREIGTPAAKKALLDSVRRSGTLADYRDLLVPYQATIDPAVVAGISALLPDMLRKLAEAGIAGDDYEAQQLVRFLAPWIHRHGTAETAELVEDLLRKVPAEAEALTPYHQQLFGVLVEFAPERAAGLALALQERVPRQQPLAFLSSGLMNAAPLARAAQYFDLLFARGGLDAEARTALYYGMPSYPFTGIEDPAKRLEDAKSYAEFLETRLGVETDPRAKAAVESRLQALRKATEQGGR